MSYDHNHYCTVCKTCGFKNRHKKHLGLDCKDNLNLNAKKQPSLLAKLYRTIKTLFAISILLVIFVFSLFVFASIQLSENSVPFIDQIGEKEYTTFKLPFVGVGNALYINNYPNVTNPTYYELVDFLLIDDTNKIRYDKNSFVCAEFSVTLHNNAEKAGIKAGVVTVDFENKKIGHALNVFETTDRGLIFIDSTGLTHDNNFHYYDSIVDLEIGKEYIPRPIYRTSGNKYTRYESMGIVENYTIYW